MRGALKKYAYPIYAADAGVSVAIRCSPRFIPAGIRHGTKQNNWSEHHCDMYIAHQ